MTFGPSPDGVFSWRFFKQSLYFATLVCASYALPAYFLPPEAIIILAHITISTTLINDACAMIYRSLDKKGFFPEVLFLLSAVVKPILHAKILHSSNPEYDNTQLSLITDNPGVLSKENTFVILGQIMCSVPFFQMMLAIYTLGKKLFSSSFSPSNTTEVTINQDIFEQNVNKFAEKAGLSPVETIRSPRLAVGASASYHEHRVTIYNGLLKLATEHIFPVLAHEVGHLKKSFLDTFIKRATIILSLFYKYFYTVLFSKAFLSFTVSLVPRDSRTAQDFIKIFGENRIEFSEENLLPQLGKLFLLPFSVMAIGNIATSGISQCEEERADRMACHLVDDPSTVEDGLAATFHAASADQEAYKIISNLLANNPVSNFVGMMFGIATHPTHSTRLHAIRDETRKVQLQRSQHLKFS